MKRLALAAGLALLCSVAAAQRLTPQMSPIVTFDPDPDPDPDREGSRPPTARPLTAAELKLARERADAIYDAVKVTPVFREPGRADLADDELGVVGLQRTVEQAFTL